MTPLPPTPDLIAIAEAVSTPGDIDSAPKSGEYGFKEVDKWYECPACAGRGEVQGSTYCNFDDKPLGVQFFGIGAEHGQWEAYFRAFPPRVVLALLSERASLQERLAKALGALERISGYAQHDNDCGANLNEPCDCGYSSAARLASQVHAELTSKTKAGIEP
jgi:hypothetical protein